MFRSIILVFLVILTQYTFRAFDFEKALFGFILLILPMIIGLLATFIEERRWF